MTASHDTASGSPAADCWRHAAWAPFALVGALILVVELGIQIALSPGPLIHELPGREAAMEWLLMSGNGLILSWALICGHGQARARGRANEPDGLLPGLVAATVLTFWVLTLAERNHVWDLTPLTITVFIPTLLIGYSLLASGLRRVKSFSVVVALAVGAALLNALCQLGYWPIVGGNGELRMLPLSSLFLGAMIGGRLTIWWTTDEGFAAPQSA